MRTHRDVVTEALVSVGLVRFGTPASGPVYEQGLKTFVSMLEQLHESSPLDFDPADEDAVPNERVEPLVQMLLQRAVFKEFNPNYDPTGQLFLRRSLELYAGINPSDFIEPEVRDF